jgi:uncharacterized protein YbjT (DUF2867 family)
MKITITGSLGHISKPLVQELVQKGHTVTVVSSSPERQKDIEALGAIAAIGTVDDVTFLTSAFTVADAVYTMIPPSQHGFADPNFDMLARWTQITNNLAEAVKNSGVKRVVHLSSIGAHTDKGVGILSGHHSGEATFSKLADADITFMRPVGFYYNLLGFIPVIKSMGMIASNYAGDQPKPWVSPIDIAAAIAQEIVTPLKGRKVIYVASDEISCTEIARILGETIGKPDLKWILLTDKQMQDAMEKAGMPKQIVTGFVEMNAAINTGLLYEDYYKHHPTLGKVKLKDYAPEFAAVYNKA